MNQKAPNRHSFSISVIHRFAPDAVVHDHISRGLTGEWYFLNDWCKRDEETGNVVLNNASHISMMKSFFHKNISVQAIVGTNGSGKTSLLDFMYRIINNFSALLERYIVRNAAEELYYINNVRGEIYYVLDGQLGRLMVFDDIVYFKYGKYEANLRLDKLVRDEEEMTEEQKRVLAVARRFFYTVVTNYSLQSFIDDDYADEDCMAVHGGVIPVPADAIWINSLFHKNDGYITPVTLNPYRHSGTIDMIKEHRLTQYRLSAIMLNLYNQNLSMIDGYRLNNIVYEFRRGAIESKYEDAGVDSDLYWNLHDLLQNKRSLASIIIQKWGYGQKELNPRDEIVRAAYLYLIYKTCSIARTYPNYNDYAEIADVKRIGQTISKEEEKLWKSLVGRIRKDESHVTIKIAQIRNFIRRLQWIQENQPEMLSDGFDYETYFRAIGHAHRPAGMWNILNTLPPSLFSIKILLDEVDKDDNVISENPIEIKRMSSGERQYLYTFSTCVYHIMNLLSIKERKRVSYKYVNLVFDEVEICFHPEYQKQLVKRLLDLLTRLSLNTQVCINVILATHSPFILSDIPDSNILYLEDGEAVKLPENHISPFAATMGDILHQSFFLKQGFMGEYAKYKINGIIRKLQQDEPLTERDYRNTKERIALIGDRFLRVQLEVKLAEKAGKVWKEY